jgi:hypothetical protein
MAYLFRYFSRHSRQPLAIGIDLRRPLYSCSMRAALIVALAAAACAQPRRDPTEVLARARDKLLDRTDRIPNYVCVETVNRSYLKNADARSWPASCDQIMGAKKKGAFKLRLDVTDRLRLDVKVSEGHEIGAWAGARRFDPRDIIEFVGDGPFGTGPLGTLIGDIFLNQGARFEYDGEESLDHTGVFKFSYHDPLEFSHYLIKSLNEWVPTAFNGDLWIEPESFDLLRLTARSSELPPETLACIADLDVVYERERIGSRDFLLPRRSELHFVMRDSTETHSLTTFSDCHEYHAESTLRFDEPTPTEPAGKGSGVLSSPALPPGLAVRLALETPIDTDTAAAGDVFAATVAKPVRGEHSKQTLIPAGAFVRGRIVVLRHFLGSSPHFQIAIRPQSIEINGAELPFYATLDPNVEFAAARKMAGLGHRGVPVWLASSGQPRNVGTFFFPTSKGRFIVPRGQQSDWITATPK